MQACVRVRVRVRVVRARGVVSDGVHRVRAHAFSTAGLRQNLHGGGPIITPPAIRTRTRYRVNVIWL